MHFEPTVTIGNIGSVVIVILSAIIAVWRVSIQLQKMQWKMDMIWKWYKKEHNIDGEDRK
jgi:uncharacterized membrane protein